MIKQTVVFLTFVFCGFSGTVAQEHKSELGLVPKPKELLSQLGHLTLPGTVTVSMPDSLADRLSVLEHDMAVLLQTPLAPVRSAAFVSFEIDGKLVGGAYEVHVGDRVVLKGNNGDALMSGWVSLLQIVERAGDGWRLPRLQLRDHPTMGYRGLLLDVAREFQSVPSVKQVIDICRWYKINYLQLHLNDDQLFVFPTTAFPEMPTKGKNYSLREMKELVEYARLRGVAIVPEFDAPGHTGSLRRAYPDLFGPEELRMLDVANPKALEACKVLIGEMIDVFYTSPYFHIGADEVFMGHFNKRPATIEAVKAHGFDEPHDLYLQYIVEMHAFVKSRGKQTLMWESFEGNGSKSVKIPNDILVFAWETMYQRPDDLINNGYTLLNASWKPAYITPNHRWTTEQIYQWNPWRWEHFLEVAPAWNPIQFGPEDHHKVVGVQFCAWEMTEEANIPGILPRLPALAEHGWNAGKTDPDFEAFQGRLAAADAKLRELLFPATFVKTGVTTGRPHERFYNRQNYFVDTISVILTSHLPGVDIRYTTDGTVPLPYDRKWTSAVRLDATSQLRVALYKGSELIGYSSELLEKRPVRIAFSGNGNDPQSPIDWTEDFMDEIRVSVEPLRHVHRVTYTWNGEAPTVDAPVLSQGTVFNESGFLRIQCFDATGKPDGSGYTYHLRKKK